jgi:osmotically-inducible protein OsmY
MDGQIRSSTELYAAKRDVRRVRGVRAVVNHLEVILPPESERTDVDLAGAAEDMLRWNSAIPAGRVSVTADNGHLTLRGEVNHHYQRQAAEESVRELVGVRSVNNQIRIVPPVKAGDVKTQIEHALVRNARMDASQIRVQVDSNKVTLTGSVPTLAAYDEAGLAVWAAPGAGEVQNNLSITG